MKLMQQLVLCSLLMVGGLIFSKEKKEKTPAVSAVVTEESAVAQGSRRRDAMAEQDGGTRKKEKTPAPATPVVVTEESAVAQSAFAQGYGVTGAGETGKKENFVVVAPPTIATEENNQIVDEDAKETKRILTTFLGMLGNFATLLSDPKNPAVVGTQIAQILSGMLAIAMEAFNKSYATADKHDLDQSIELDDTFIADLKTQFIAYADKLKLAHDC